MSTKYCIKCGKPNNGKIPFIGPLCMSCYLEVNKVLCVPENLKVEICKYCSAIRIGGRWLPSNGFEDAIDRHIKSYLTRIRTCDLRVEGFKLLKLTTLTTPSWRTILKATYSISFKDIKQEGLKEYIITLRFIPSICPVCKEARSKDYNVLVQIRGESKPQLVSSIYKIMESNSQISQNILDIIESKNGFDILFYEKGAASKFIKEVGKLFRTSIKRTSETVGINSRGKIRRRLVVSVHIHNSKEG